jgi:hypothetical protein
LVLGVVTMARLAVVLALCSEADAFVASSLTILPLVPRLVFLVVGPAVDVKLFVMQSGCLVARLPLGSPRPPLSSPRWWPPRSACCSWAVVDESGNRKRVVAAARTRNGDHHCHRRLHPLRQTSVLPRLAAVAVLRIVLALNAIIRDLRRGRDDNTGRDVHTGTSSGAESCG